MGIGIKMITHPKRLGKWIGDRFEDLTGVTSAKKANQQNIEQAQIARDWEERMSNTAYQRGTADMLKAGLNPMLAYSQGGASTPSTSAATVQQEQPGGPMATLGKAFGINLQKQQAAQAQASIGLAQATTAKTMAETTSQEIKNTIDAWDIPYAEQISANKRDQASAQIKQALRQADKLIADANLTRAQEEQIRKLMPEMLKQAQAETTLLQSQVPSAQAEAKLWEEMGAAGKATGWSAKFIEGLSKAVNLIKGRPATIINKR